MGIGSLVPRSQASRYFDLIHMVPNRPYTHITTDHYNNGGLDIKYRNNFNAYFSTVLGESTYWGNAPAPLYACEPIPRCGSWATTLAGQSPGTAALTYDINVGQRWLYRSDIMGKVFPQLSGYIPTNLNYSYDQSTNIDKAALQAKSYTLTADMAVGATSISVTESPTVGDFIVYDATKSNGGTNVRAISGTGPYTLTLYPSVVTAKTSGSVLPCSNVGDSAGLHPSGMGAPIIAANVRSWLNNTFG